MSHSFHSQAAQAPILSTLSPGCLDFCLETANPRSTFVCFRTLQQGQGPGEREAFIPGQTVNEWVQTYPPPNRCSLRFCVTDPSILKGRAVIEKPQCPMLEGRRLQIKTNKQKKPTVARHHIPPFQIVSICWQLPPHGFSSVPASHLLSVALYLMPGSGSSFSCFVVADASRWVSAEVIFPNRHPRFQRNHCSAFFLPFPPHAPSVLLLSVHSNHTSSNRTFFLAFLLFRNLKLSLQLGQWLNTILPGCRVNKHFSNSISPPSSLEIIGRYNPI